MTQKKRIIGWGLCAVGIAAIVFAVDAMVKLSEAKTFVDSVSEFFQHNPSTWNPIITFFGGKAQEEIADYNAPVLALLVCGILLTAAGAAMSIIYRKRKEKR